MVAPRTFHFTITALTVDQGSSSRLERKETDLLERWHSMKFTELFSKAILLPMFVWRFHGCVFDYIHLSATGVAEIAESTHLIH
jgi:hypothetical protein